MPYLLRAMLWCLAFGPIVACGPTYWRNHRLRDARPVSEVGRLVSDLCASAIVPVTIRRPAEDDGEERLASLNS